MPRFRRVLATAACAVLTATALALPSAPARADDDGDPDPLRGLLLPPVDAVVALLAPFPIPATPYTGEVCVSGADACIDDVIVRMEDRLDGLVDACSHSAVFSLAYLR